MTEFSGGNQILIEKLTEIIVANLSNEHFGVRELFQQYGLTRSRLNRRLFVATGKTIHQFIRETRLMKALEILRNEDVTVAEVAFRTGFSSPAYLNTSFHEFFGYPPGKVKKGETEVRNGNIPAAEAAGVKQKRLARRTLILTLSGIAFIVVIVLQFIYPGHIISFRRNTLENLIASGYTFP